MERFINPYNFISLSGKPNREQGTKAEKKYTGSITYSLTTKSSLFIPNTSSSKAFSYTPNKEDDPRNEHELYDFFSYNILDKNKTYDEEWFEPVIPGSEVRGMIRSIYETLTNSCLCALDGEKRIGKRTVEHFRPAVLKREKGQIYLYDITENKKNGDAIYRDSSDFSVKKHLLCTYQDGAEVSFTLKTSSDSNAWYIKPDIEYLSDDPDEYPRKGYLLKGNQGKKHSPEIASNDHSKCYPQDGKPGCIMYETGKCPGKSGKGTEHCYLAEKHCAHIFYIPDRLGAKYELNEVSIETLRIVLNQYLKEDPDSYREYEVSYRNFINGNTNGLPVYYSALGNNEYIMLSPACITREVYKNTVSTLVDTYKKCNSKERELCPACRLFGIANSNVAQGSRVRFSDLLPVKKVNDWKEYYDKPRTLDPLAVPHLENTEFYLKKPIDPDGEVWFWTYDYYTVKKADGEVVVKSYHPEISGRKFYWNNLSGVKECGTQTPLNRTVRTVRPGVEFTGEIYFDEINETQLKQLIYILTYTSDGKHGYKLGMGKPLGLGSVELTMKDLSIRVFDGEGYRVTQRIGNAPIDPEGIHKSSFKTLKLDERAEKPFELLTRYLADEDMKRIHYPKTDDGKEEEGFQWFGENKVYHKLDNNNKMKGTKMDNSPKSRLQIEIKNALPVLDEDNIPWILFGRDQRLSSGSDQRISGTVKFFDKDKNYGYIAAEDSSNDYKISLGKYNPNIHAEDLRKGCKVTFVPKNLNGKNVANQCRLAE